MLETLCCSSIVAIAVNAMVDRHAHWSNGRNQNYAPDKQFNGKTAGCAYNTGSGQTLKTKILVGTDQSQGS